MARRPGTGCNGEMLEVASVEYLFDTELMGVAVADLAYSVAQVTPLPAEPDWPADSDWPAGQDWPAEPDRLAEPGSAGRRDGLVGLISAGTVVTGTDIGADGNVLPGADLLPVLPALCDLLPAGSLRRGTVVATAGWGLLSMALAAGPVASGAWCAIAGVSGMAGAAGVAAAADAGLDPARLLLVPDLGANWPQVVASLLDGFDLVLLRPPDRPAAQTRRKLEAAVRRHRSVLLVAGEWEGAQARLQTAASEWAGIGRGHGRLRARRVQVVADGRGGWAQPRARWLWLPGPDGTIRAAIGDVAVPPVVAAESTG